MTTNNNLDQYNEDDIVMDSNNRFSINPKPKPYPNFSTNLTLEGGVKPEGAKPVSFNRIAKEGSVKDFGGKD